MGEEDKERKQSIKSIRGIDDKLYEQLTIMAKQTGRTVGELINESIKLLLGLAGKATEVGRNVIQGYSEAIKSGDVEVIAGLEELDITSRDLEGIEKPVEFRNIRKLIFKEIPYDLFEKKVRAIAMSDLLVIPDEYPKLKVAMKCSMVKKIVYLSNYLSASVKEESS